MNRKRIFILTITVILSLGFLSRQQFSLPSEAETLVGGTPACAAEDNDFHSNDDVIAFQANLDAEKERLAARMRQSDSVDDQVVAAAAFTPRHTKLASLQTLAEKYPDNTLAALQILKLCLSDIAAPGCGPEIIDQVSTLAGDNAFAWALIAKYQSLQDDDYGFLAALRQANAATFYNDYFREQMGILNQAIPNDSNWLNHGLRLGIIDFMIDASLLPHSVLLTRNCAVKVSEQPLLADYCLTLGKRISDESGVLLHQKLGLSLQEVVYTKIGEYSKRNTTQDQLYALSTSMQIGPGEAGALVDELLQGDQELGKIWIEAFINEGEMHARQLLIAKAQEISLKQDYHSCSSE